ncbi:hemerythrin domain-containing protein [Halomonas korlensis]|uniref:Hemerythrin HHE cation binding domain-containing protein n=1 Tax=Halomonas korlensis TaxID=463301 RepID=A0A1I7K8D2_9GAMM|nr:hemerythrin domain-containing protein [Halomonas korlensis]SFU93612.1 Hemerythrin HHE cation binding domain-containing protein [Halomonas korlensis]
MNALDLLKQDHEKVLDLLTQLVETTEQAAKKRPELLTKIEKELHVHTQIEEEIFYPAFLKAAKKKEDERLYHEAREEHRAVEDQVMPDLKQTDPASTEFSGKAKVLKELVEHHASEEEDEMFEHARQFISENELEQLGEQMEERKAQLMAK